MPQRRITDPTSQPITWGDGTRATETNQIDAPPVIYSDMPGGAPPKSDPGTPPGQTPGWPGPPPDKGPSPIDPGQTPGWPGIPPEKSDPNLPNPGQTPPWPGPPPDSPVIGDPQWPEPQPPVKPGPTPPMQSPGFPGPRPPLGIQDMLQQVIQPVRKQGPMRRRLR